MNSREIDNRNLSDMEQYYLARIETLNNRIAELERALRAAPSALTKNDPFLIRRSDPHWEQDLARATKAALVELSKNQRSAGGYVQYLQAKYATEGVRG